MPFDEALASLREIRGIGEWSSQHVLLRGAGVADAVPLADPRTRIAIRAAYDLPVEPDDTQLTAISDAWRPFRMWGFVLVRLWHGRSPVAATASRPVARRGHSRCCRYGRGPLRSDDASAWHAQRSFHRRNPPLTSAQP